MEHGIGMGEVTCGAWDRNGGGDVWSTGLEQGRSYVLVVDSNG